MQGNAIIIPCYETEPSVDELDQECNEGVAIKYLVSAPTMRVPLDVKNTPNAYLAFRATILAGIFIYPKGFVLYHNFSILLIHWFEIGQKTRENVNQGFMDVCYKQDFLNFLYIYQNFSWSMNNYLHTHNMYFSSGTQQTYRC